MQIIANKSKYHNIMLIIKEIRESKKLTQDEVVTLSGIKKRTYVDYENGKSDIPMSKLQNIATALKVHIFELFEDYTNLQSENTQSTEMVQMQFENEALRKENTELKKDKEFLQSLLQRTDNDKSRTA